MNVKIDTKEKFTTITVEESALPANMTDKIKELLLSYLQKDIPHVILKLNEVNSIDPQVANILAKVKGEFYEKNCSFVICSLQKPIEKMLNEMELFESMNITPTESEAWDIVQMEEIERELLNDNL